MKTGILIALWGNVVCANVWAAADRFDRGWPWLAFAAVCALALIWPSGERAGDGFWSRVWRR